MLIRPGTIITEPGSADETPSNSRFLTFEGVESSKSESTLS